MFNMNRNRLHGNAVLPVTLRKPLPTADLELLVRLAEDRESSATILGVLSSHFHERIRAAVADNSCTPCMALLRLARDKSVDIRYQLAENHNVPMQVLLILVVDENPYVQVRAARTLERLQTV